MSLELLIVTISLLASVVLINLIVFAVFGRRAMLARFIVIVSLVAALFGGVMFWLSLSGWTGPALLAGSGVFLALLTGAALLFFYFFVKPVNQLLVLLQPPPANDESPEPAVLPLLSRPANRGRDELGQLFDLLQTANRRNEYLATVVSRVADGDLNARLEAEFADGYLERAFVRMLRHWRVLIAQIQAGVQALGASEASLSEVTVAADEATRRILEGANNVTRSAVVQAEVVNRTNITMQQFSQSINNIVSGAYEQAQEVHRTTAAVDKMSRSMEQVGKSAQLASQTSVHVNEAAHSGANTIQQMLLSMESIGQSVYQAAERVQEMEKRSAQIGSIVEAIEGIAAQTEMLALNAAIEAARAGEHGKPFAVVADAVRQLADRATSQTKGITGLIDQVQRDVQEMIVAMALSADQVRQGNELAAEVRRKLDEILQAVDSSDEQLKEILNAVHYMDGSKKEMIQAVETVSAVIEENTAMTEQMTNASREVQENINTVSEVSDQNGVIVADIDTSAGQMKEQVDQVMVASGGLKGMTVGLASAIKNFNLSSVSDQAARLNIAYMPIADHLLLPITYLRQLQSADSATFQMTRCVSWPQLVERLKSKEVHGALILAPLATHLSRELPLRIVLPAHRNGSGLVVDNAINNLAALRGKTIAIPHLYSTHHILLYKALNKAGIDYHEVKVIPAPPPLMPYLLQRGKLAGFISAEPSLEVALSIKAGRIEILSKDIDYGHICCVLAIKQEALAQNQTALVQLLADFMQAGLWVQSNTRQAAEDVSPFFGIDPRVTERVLTTPPDRITYADFSLRKSEFVQLAQVMVRMNLLPETFDVEPIIDTVYYEQALKLINPA